MNSPDYYIHYLGNPNELPEWTDRDKMLAAERLVDKIMDGEPWDENLEGWKGDMYATWENIMLDRTLDKDEQWAQMRDAHFEYVSRYARDEVENDPNKYCEDDDEYAD